MRIMIAAPNPAKARLAEAHISADPRLRLAGTFNNLTACYHAVEHRPPAIVLIASQFAEALEFEVMQHLFDALSVRWVLLGAADEAKALYQSKSFRDPAPAVDPSKTSREFCTDLLSSALRTNKSVIDFRHAPRSGTWERLFLIGSSTGGVDALMTVLSALPTDCPPTLIVQHTGEGFSAGLARLLDSNCKANVREAKNGDLIERGTVFLAPSGKAHMKLDMSRGPRCRLIEGPPVSGHRPSVDVLFRSALHVARRCTATILTGMGRDGADGLLELRRNGATTFGQDEGTSMVYGMPKAAFENGAVETQLPIQKIGPSMLSSVRRHVA